MLYLRIIGRGNGCRRFTGDGDAHHLSRYWLVCTIGLESTGCRPLAACWKCAPSVTKLLAVVFLQVLEMRGGVDLVVATPGRLLDLVETRKCIRLYNVKQLVLDEADMLLGLSLEGSVRRLINNPQLPKVPVRRTALFSATLPSQVRAHLDVENKLV